MGKEDSPRLSPLNNIRGILIFIEFPLSTPLPFAKCFIESFRIGEMSSSVTQIIYLKIKPDIDLTDSKSEPGKRWSEALDLLEGHGGFRRLYWGRSPEDMSQVQLHVGK